MPPFLAPALDVVFKLLFTRDADSREALVSLLTAVLRPPQPITEIEVLNPTIGAGEIADKDIVLDILVRLADRTTLNVEMQARKLDAFRERLLFYWARTYGQLLGVGDDYPMLRPTIVIAFLGYREDENPRFHSVFRLLETQTHTSYSDALSIHLIQLPLLAALTDVDRRDEQALLPWIRFFAARTREEAEAAAMDDPTISKMNEILKRLTGEPDVQEMARRRELAQAARLITHGAIHERGRREGEEHGIRVGEERGIRVGEERGLRAAIRGLCAAFGIPLDDAREAALEAMDAAELGAFVERLGAARAWP
jgi:predicted transposase/invertase (TIGR01784 family)